MTVRSFDLRDLPNLYRFRGEVAGLDTARLLTRGNPLGAVGLLAYVNPARHIYSCVADGAGGALLGGIIHTRRDSFARLLYLAPAWNLDHPELPVLIEHLTVQAGSWGAFHVLAEVDEMSAAFDGLHAAGFSVYAWQRVWNLSHLKDDPSSSDWLRVETEHLPAIQSLYQQIVPPLLHPLELMPQRPMGWIHNGGPRCYMNMVQGMYGIVFMPLIHPEAADLNMKLLSLLGHLPERRGRPVYICVRSYQAWLEPVLQDLGATPGTRQAVMVKHLARPARDEQTAQAVKSSAVSMQATRVSKLQRRHP